MKWSCVPWFLGLLTFSSCGLFGGSTARERPISPDEAYLPRSSNNDIDLGPDQQNLTQRLQDEEARVRDLKEKIKRLESDKIRLNAELNTTGTVLAKTQEVKTTAEHEVTQLTLEVRELKTKVLMLQIKKAQLEQSNILMRLAAIRTQQDAVQSTKLNASPMSGANR